MSDSYDEGALPTFVGYGFILFFWIIAAVCLVHCYFQTSRRRRYYDENLEVERYQRRSRASLYDVNVDEEAPPPERNLPPGMTEAQLRVKTLNQIFAAKSLVMGDIQYDEKTNTPSWKDANKTTEPSCPICLETFETGDTVIESSCDHVYHCDCIMAWLEKKSKCPLCRESLWDNAVYVEIEGAILKEYVAQQSNEDAPEEPAIGPATIPRTRRRTTSTTTTAGPTRTMIATTNVEITTMAVNTTVPSTRTSTSSINSRNPTGTARSATRTITTGAQRPPSRGHAQTAPSDVEIES